MLTDTHCRNASPEEKFIGSMISRVSTSKGIRMVKRNGAIGLNSTVNPACLRWVNIRRLNLLKLARNYCWVALRRVCYIILFT